MREDCWYKDVCTSSCTSSCIRYIEMEHLVSSSGIPKALQRPPVLEVTDCDYDAYVALQNIKDNIVEFVENGNNLLICSKTTGNGKTTWAIKIMLKFFDTIWAGNGLRNRAKFIHVPTFLAKLKDFEHPLSEQEKKDILECDLVVWDDIASTGLSQYDYSQLLTYVDQRILPKKSNIFTSNAVKIDDFEKAVGVKLTSRIFNTSKIVEFVGRDRRN